VPPLKGVPTKRVIIFAGSEGDIALAPLLATKPEAILLSFKYLRNKKDWPKLRKQLDGWEHYRYLDSGVYTYISSWLTESIEMSREQVREEFEAYCEFLAENHQHFSWMVDFDVDSVCVDGSKPPGLGVQLTKEHRRVLRKIVGDKLLPVWHIAAGYDHWIELITEYPYVAIGHDRNPKDLWQFQRMIRRAHERDVKVHGLAVGGFDEMRRVPYDTGDATNWMLGPLKHGTYANGVPVPDRRRPLNRNELIRLYQFEEKAKAWGYDLYSLDDDGKLELNIKLIQEEVEEMQWPTNELTTTTNPSITTTLRS